MGTYRTAVEGPQGLRLTPMKQNSSRFSKFPWWCSLAAAWENAQPSRLKSSSTLSGPLQLSRYKPYSVHVGSLLKFQFVITWDENEWEKLHAHATVLPTDGEEGRCAGERKWFHTTQDRDTITGCVRGYSSAVWKISNPIMDMLANFCKVCLHKHGEDHFRNRMIASHLKITRKKEKKVQWHPVLYGSVSCATLFYVKDSWLAITESD